jgi:hypothetical protein
MYRETPLWIDQPPWQVVVLIGAPDQFLSAVPQASISRR